MRQGVWVLSLLVLAVSVPIAFGETISYTQQECDDKGVNDFGINLTNYLVICDYPFEIEVDYDTRVLWIDNNVWNGTYNHTITMDDGSFSHENMGSVDFFPGAVWNVDSTYTFYDKINPTLTGSIKVLNNTESVIISSGIQTATASEATSESSTTTQSSSSSSSTEDEPVNEITTSFVIGEHAMSIIMADYQGTSKFVTFTGGNFTTSDTLDIKVTDSNNLLIVDIQTMISGAGDFSVPAIVDTTTLSNENYNVTLKSQNSDLAFVISWTGTVFSFEGETVLSTSSETTSTASTSTTSSDTTTTSTVSTSNISDWNKFILDLSFEDRLDLIKAVFSYILG